MPGPQLRGSNPFTGNHITPGPGMPGPYRAAKKSVCFLCTRSFLMSQYVVIVVPTK